MKSRSYLSPCAKKMPHMQAALTQLMASGDEHTAFAAFCALCESARRKKNYTRQQGDNLEYIALGDVTAVLEFTDGSLQPLEETQLTQLDRSVFRKMQSLVRDTGCTMAEARQACNDLVIYNRSLRNRPGGILDT